MPNYVSASNNTPREGAAIASHWVFSVVGCGRYNGQRYGACKDPYFRTTVHEMGHAFGLAHNTADLGFINTTSVIAASPSSPPFSDNIVWGFHPTDVSRLRHWPDAYIRNS